MADDAPTTDAAAEGTPAATTDTQQVSGETFTQKQVNDLLALQKGKVERRFEGFDDIKAKAEKLDEIEEEQRSETEKLAKERDTLKERLTPLETENLRLRVAIEKGLDPDLIDRLHGTTKEELEADADELLKKFGAKEEPAATDFDGGARTTPDEKKKPEAAHNDFLASVLEQST